MCNERPINRLHWINRAQDMEKTRKPREFLRGDADEPLELRVQMVLADPKLLTELANRQGATMVGNLPKSMLHQTETLRHPREASKQKLLEEGKSCLDSRRVM